MKLTPEYKLTVIKFLISRIFINFNLKEYNVRFADLIQLVAAHDNVPNALSILYEGNYYTPFNTDKHKFNAIFMTKKHKYYQNFITLVQEKNDFHANSAVVRNYISNGLAICQKFEQIGQVFPQCVLDIFNTIHDESFSLIDMPSLVEQPASLPKFQSFKDRNVNIVEQIKKQLVFNIIAPGALYAKINVQ
jgi:hypothetical protein